MKEIQKVFFLLLLTSMQRTKATGYSPPGKPALTSCRSPEKETFTCWWQPGSDGGLPTTYALYYRKENSETVYECPDYHTAGENSCFFNKNDTSIWVNYNITVVASNAMGSAFSDPVDIDVVYIVQPNPPEKLSLTLMKDKGWPFLRVSWEPPRKADTRSGWITLIYEIRIKLEEESDWETHLAGQQKFFNIFSLRSGGTYLVQVRCKPDHGFWSEWTSASVIGFPDYFHREKSMWVLISVFSAFIFLIVTWLLHMNSRSLKHCLLPPVPGPKIKGFDKHLLKNGNAEEIFSALVVSDFPPTSPSNCDALLVEYLEVYVPEEQELMLEETKDLHDGCLKSESSTSDSDSGRGSCDSHTLLMDKCGEEKEEGQVDRESKRHHKEWKTNVSAQDDTDSSGISGGRVKTWPSVFSPLPQYNLNHEQQSSLEIAKQHSFSDNLFPPSSASSYMTQPGTKEGLGPGYWEFSLSSKQPHPCHPQRPIHHQIQAHSDVNISCVSPKMAAAGSQSPFHQSTEYVEVQRVNEKNMVLLQPVPPGPGHGAGGLHVPTGRDYSKVRRVDSDNMLLLQRNLDFTEEEEKRCPCLNQETTGGYTTSPSTTLKSSACTHNDMPLQEERVLAVNGYVDAATMLTVPTY